MINYNLSLNKNLALKDDESNILDNGYCIKKIAISRELKFLLIILI